MVIIIVVIGLGQFHIDQQSSAPVDPWHLVFQVYFISQNHADIINFIKPWNNNYYFNESQLASSMLGFVGGGEPGNQKNSKTLESRKLETQQTFTCVAKSRNQRWEYCIYRHHSTKRFDSFLLQGEQIQTVLLVISSRRCSKMMTLWIN